MNLSAAHIPSHPTLARTNAIYDYEEDFDRERFIILTYLEPQYQRIAEESKIVGSFIEAHIQPGGFLSPTFRKRKDFKGHEETYTCNLTDALACLQEHADALRERDMPKRIRVKRNASLFDQNYASLPAETALRNMRSTLHEAVLIDLDIYSFRRDFKAEVDNLDDQHNEIRRTRNMLYKFDVLPSG